MLKTTTHTHPLSHLYRNAMSNVAASVHVVTTDGPAGSYGITMTAVTSVTDDPPTLILCINRHAAIQPILRANAHLCVNVLAAHQRDVAEHFAGITHLDSATRFRQHNWQPGPSGQPQVTGALAHLSGHIVEHKDLGSHTVFYVLIEHIQVTDTTEPALLYYRRHFTHSAI
ncbi:flavin reductase [Snodgrassella sp. CFCC 13594]|uniref:flavin reductase n=1 Tax=Snodgrassella sp. CFCC 13594 TaxID=1775559 RepID=UPI00082B417B|nr:flavin reductase [Snodgrassella sp. CFCC 13594]